VGATLAFGIAQGMGLDYPIFALVAAVIATDLTPAQCASSDCAGSSRRSSARCPARSRLRRVVPRLGADVEENDHAADIAGDPGTKLAGLWAVGPSILVAMLICYRVGGPKRVAFFRMIEDRARRARGMA